MIIKRILDKYNSEILPRVRHRRGAVRISEILEDLALRNEEKVKESEELDVFRREWDNLVIVDAARADFWKEETGMRGTRVSKGSATTEYIENNFSEGEFADYVYVSANPQFSDWKFKKLTGRLPDETFHSIFKTFNTDWDEDANTVLPENTVEDALTAQKLFPKKELIIHFLPPHYPFVRRPVTNSGIAPDLPGRKDSAWNYAEKGRVGHDVVEESYRDNMRYVADYVQDLVEELEGKTVITSDHGNFVGEKGFYGHMKGRMEEPVKRVPYVEL
jgi:hypothetical protein